MVAAPTAWFPAIAAIVLAAVWCIPAEAASNEAGCTLSDPERRTVAEVKDGETLILTDGTVVRLVGAKAPQAPLGWRGDEPWPLVKESKGALERLASGAEVELRFGGARADRHGYALAQVYVVKGDTRQWLHGELVGQGLAQVYSFPDNHACVGELLAREAEARAGMRGIWGSWAYRVLNADDTERIARLKNTYQLVEGVVAAAGEAGGRNFAKDWRSDFTIVVERNDEAAFKAAGMDLKALAGKRVQVRGWVEWRNGPMIAASHPEQIELLPDLPAPEHPDR